MLCGKEAKLPNLISLMSIQITARAKRSAASACIIVEASSGLAHKSPKACMSDFQVLSSIILVLELLGTRRAWKSIARVLRTNVIPEYRGTSERLRTSSLVAGKRPLDSDRNWIRCCDTGS
jgi:hypothetical protein